jgi:hypothetical protein
MTIYTTWSGSSLPSTFLPGSQKRRTRITPQASLTPCIINVTIAIASVTQEIHKNHSVVKPQHPPVIDDHTFIPLVIHHDSDGLNVSPSPTSLVGIRDLKRKAGKLEKRGSGQISKVVELVQMFPWKSLCSCRLGLLLFRGERLLMFLPPTPFCYRSNKWERR